MCILDLACEGEEKLTSDITGTQKTRYTSTQTTAANATALPPHPTPKRKAAATLVTKCAKPMLAYHGPSAAARA